MRAEWTIEGPEGYPHPHFFKELEPSEEFPFLLVYREDELWGFMRVWLFGSMGVKTIGDLPFSGATEWFALNPSNDYNSEIVSTISKALLKKCNGGRIALSFDSESILAQLQFQTPWKTMPSKTTFLLHLSQRDRVWEGIKPKRKNAIRSYLKSPVEISETLSQADVDFLAQFIPKNLHSFLYRMARRKKDLVVKQIRHEGELQALAVGVICGAEMKYIWGGAKRGSGNLGSSVLWLLIEEAIERSISIFNFEGSSIPGVYAFFKSFGGEEVALIQLGHMGWKMSILNALKFWK